MKRAVELVILSLLLFSPYLALVVPAFASSEPLIIAASTVNWSSTIPGVSFMGVAGPSKTVSYSFYPNGTIAWGNDRDSAKFSPPTLGGLLTPTLYSNSTTVGYHMKFGSIVNAWVYFKQTAVKGNLKVIISGTTTLSGTFCLPVGGKQGQTLLNSSRVMWGTVGFDWKDSVGLTPTFSSGKLCYTISAGSFLIDPATIGTSTDSFATSASFQLKTLKAQTRYWDFYGDGTNCVWRTSTDGTTWSSPTTVRACATTAVVLSIYYDSTNNVVYYVYSPNSGTQFFYRYGTPASDGTISWSIAETGVTTTKASPDGGYIFATSTSDIWVTTYTTDGTNQNFEVWRYGGVSWADKLDVAVGTGFPGRTTMILGLTSGKAMVYVDGTAGVAQACVRTTGDNGATWSTAVCDTTITYRNDNKHHAVAVGDVVHFVGSSTDANPKIEYWKCTYPCSSITGLTQISSGLAGFTGTSMSQDSNDLLIFYADASDVYYVQSTNGGSSFGTQQTVSSTESSIQVKTLTSSFAISSNDVQVTWTAGSASPFNVRFAQLTLTVSDTLTLTVSPVGGTQGTFTLSGGGVSLTSVVGDGTSKSFTCNPGNPPVTITQPAPTPTTRLEFAGPMDNIQFKCDGTGHTFTYYSQQKGTQSYSGAVAVGGAPSLKGTALGSVGTSITMPGVAAAFWFDQATATTVTKPTTDFPSSTHRYNTNWANVSMSGGVVINPVFYEQFLVTNPGSLGITRIAFGSSSAVFSTSFWADAATALTSAGTYSCALSSLNNATWVYQFSPSGLQLFVGATASSLIDNTPTYIQFTETGHAIVCLGSSGLSISKITANGASASFTQSSSLIYSYFTGSALNEVDFATKPSGGGTTTPPSGGGGSSGGGSGGSVIITTTTQVTTTNVGVPSVGTQENSVLGSELIGAIVISTVAFAYVQDHYDIVKGFDKFLGKDRKGGKDRRHKGFTK